MRTGIMIVVAGLLGAALSFLVLAGVALPYQDPTPEMLERQSDQVRFWAGVMLANILLSVAGGCAMWRARRKK